jgi:hypothetical protein
VQTAKGEQGVLTSRTTPGLLPGTRRGNPPAGPNTAQEHDAEDREDDPAKGDQKNALHQTEIIPFPARTVVGHGLLISSLVHGISSFSFDGSQCLCESLLAVVEGRAAETTRSGVRPCQGREGRGAQKCTEENEGKEDRQWLSHGVPPRHSRRRIYIA